MSQLHRIKLDLPPILGSSFGGGQDVGSIAFTQSPLFWLLLYVRFGGEVTINGTLYEFPADSVIVAKPSSLIHFTRTEPDTDSTIFYLHFQENPQATFEVGIRPVSTLGVGGQVFARSLNRGFDYSSLSKSAVQSVLWFMLWDVSVGLAPLPEHPAMDKLNSFLDKALSEPISVSQMAEEAGVSHNHLIRLVKAQSGLTPQLYLRSRRMEMASHLLVSSPLSIKEIAHRVGIPDLQQFNKTVRETFGSSPRKLRSGNAMVKTFWPDSYDKLDET